MKRGALVLLMCALPACSGTPGESLGGPFFGVQAIAVSKNGVFVTSNPNGNDSNVSLERLPLAGGAPSALVSQGAAVTALAIDATNAYVVDGKGIQQVPQAGGTTVTLVSADAAGEVAGLAVGGGNVAWIQIDPSSGVAGQIWVTPAHAGGTPSALSMSLSGPCAIAADAKNVYWLDCADKNLASLPLDGSASSPNVLATGLALPDGQLATAPLAVAGGFVFWGEPGTGAIRKVAAAGGSPSTLAKEAGQIPSQIVTDGADVYWLDQASADDLPSSAWKVPAAGGTIIEVLSPDQNQNGGYTALALDASYLYFDDNDDGSIRRLAR